MNKKASIIETASRLFSLQGFEATTTLQIAREVGITEPAVFYHFKSKNALFSEIIEDAAARYIKRIEALDMASCQAMDCIEKLIRIHFQVVSQNSYPFLILLRTCPARMKASDNSCSEVYRKTRVRLKDASMQILESGMASGEFKQIDVDATANLLIAMLYGLMHQQAAALDPLKGVEAATISFCKNALLNEDGGTKRRT